MNKRKRNVFYLLFSFFAVAVLVFSYARHTDTLYRETEMAQANIVATLDGTNAPTTETTYQASVVSNKIPHATYTYTKVKAAAGSHAMLDVDGSITKDEAKGLVSMKIIFSGELKVRTWFLSTDTDYYEYHIKSDSATSLRGNFFKIIAVAETTITSVTLTYSCTTASEKPTSELASLDLTALTYHSLVGKMFINPDVIAPEVSRSSPDAMAFKFEIPAASPLEPRHVNYMVYIDTGSATASRGDGTSWIFYLYGSGVPASINRDSGATFDASKTKTTIVGKTLYFAVKYSALGISNTDQYGVTFGSRNIKVGDLRDWFVDGLPFADAYKAEHGSTYANPSSPNCYVRVLANAAFTWTKKDNKLVPLETLDTDGYRVIESTFGGGRFNGGIATKVRHGATGIEFVFTGQYDLTGNKVIELFIDLGLPNTGQTPPWFRLDLKFDGTTSNADLYTYSISGKTLTATVLYTGLGISPTDQIGFTFGMLNNDGGNGSIGWDGFGWWKDPATATMIAYNTEYGNTFIQPENANRYLRLLSDDSITFTKADLTFYK
ncbi:MAG: hypothetical protein BWX74_00415 [Tenericutes bacterium ADurb.Bin087]|nr:MAG: hypothetical protein BWX74_00415 [Tenericutes bacterium ADurb.Bin087]